MISRHHRGEGEGEGEDEESMDIWNLHTKILVQRTAIEYKQ